ncbi:MAG: Nif11-like leader peptide family RiPP precursor [Eggerthellaceae bacterium]|nr:Nif11-like leader peptide family RiPP precursor [Eggerthellaceae bacterium]
MAETGIKAFEAALRADEELRQKFQDAMRRIAESDEKLHEQEVIVAAARELGYEFTIEELDRSRAEVQELDDAELEAVTGGAGGPGCRSNYDDPEDEKGHDNSCVTLWHCHAITLHTESNSTYVNCWSDWMCMSDKNHNK